MAAQVEPEQGLARAFAEYSLLPDLLVRTVPGEGAPASWTQLLGDIGFTVDHIDDDELPPGLGVTAIMAEDAWRISQWLELVDADGLTDAGRQIAEVARTSMKDRSEAVWGPADAVLAQQVRECYRGGDGLCIADLVRDGAGTLEQAEDNRARFCPGLLLVEFESLLYLAQADPPRARALIDELPHHRRAAMREFPPPRPEAAEILNMVLYADAVSRYYTEALAGYVNDRVLTLTAAQATSILFVSCGLLMVPAPHLPVQYLAVPS